MGGDKIVLLDGAGANVSGFYFNIHCIILNTIKSWILYNHIIVTIFAFK